MGAQFLNYLTSGVMTKLYRLKVLRISDALHLLHSENEPLSHSINKQHFDCTLQHRYQLIQPSGFRLWRSKRINPVSLHRPTGICWYVCVHVCVRGVCQVLEAAHKIIPQHSTPILYGVTPAHIFHRRYLQHTQAVYCFKKLPNQWQI